MARTRARAEKEAAEEEAIFEGQIVERVVSSGRAASRARVTASGWKKDATRKVSPVN